MLIVSWCSVGVMDEEETRDLASLFSLFWFIFFRLCCAILLIFHFFILFHFSGLGFFLIFHSIDIFCICLTFKRYIKYTLFLSYLHHVAFAYNSDFLVFNFRVKYWIDIYIFWLNICCYCLNTIPCHRSL